LPILRELGSRGKKGPLGILPVGPVRKALYERKTIVLKEPLVKALGLDPQVLPPGVTYEEAVAVIEGSRWAKGLADGMCSKLFGTVPGTKEHDACVKRVARRVAEGLLR